jgi:carboxylesterase type B
MRRLLFRVGASYGKISDTKLFPFAGAYNTAFLPKDVLDAMGRGTGRHIDLLIGTARHDGRLLSVSVPGPKALTTRLSNYMIAGMIGETNEQRKAIVTKYQTLMPCAPGFRVRSKDRCRAYAS